MRICTLILCLMLFACRAPLQRPSEILDPVTAATVSHASRPLVFARAHQDVAANQRQLATVVGASVNRSGRYEYLLLVYIWSTVDVRLGAGLHPGDTLVLLADDRLIRLPRDPRTAREAGIASPAAAPPHWRGSPRVYVTDRQTLQFLSRARRLRLQLEGDADLRPFDLWRDGRRELGELAAAAN